MKFSLQLVYNWYRNSIRNPKYRWWIILGSLLYFVSPIDFAPDFLPFVGEIDDTILMTLLFSEVSQMLLEGFKARRETQDEAPDTVDASTAASTVDVKAVSVK